MTCKTYEAGSLKEYKYVVILSEYQGKILLSRHKNRTPAISSNAAGNTVNTLFILNDNVCKRFISRSVYIF